MMGLKQRIVLLGLFAWLIGWPLWWAMTESPRAKRAARARGETAGCVLEKTKADRVKVVRIKVSVSKYPQNWRHMVDARAGRNTGRDGVTVVNDGLRWPTVLTKNSVGEDARRDAGMRLAGLPAKTGMARDEYPPAEGRATDAADFRYVLRGPNGAQGASMGGQLRRYCDGQRYKLVAAP
jgi:hypothetical protein